MRSLERNGWVSRDDNGHPYLRRLLSIFSSARLNAELQPDRWMISGSERFRRFFICFPMDQPEINNWKSIAESMEAKGNTESWFTFVPVQLLMGSLIPCPTSQNCWLTLLDLLDNRDGVGHRALARLSQAFREPRAREPANIQSPKRLQWC